jgi:class 3 adenylate cyclase/TolB-like protein
MTHSEDHPQNESHTLEEGQRKLTTIMFSDICGYTRMMGKNEAKTLQLVKRNLEIHQGLLNKYNGTLIKEMGDGLLTCFDSPSDAVSCAKEILAAVSYEEELNLHIGVHQGEVIFTENDVYGEGVNITARIDSEAWPGEILVSEDVWKNIRNKDEFVAISIGKKQMKNVAEPMELFRILITEEDNSEKYQQFIRRRKAPILRFGLMAVAIMIIVAAAFLWYDTYYNVPIEEYKTIAILPFQNETNNEDLEYLSEGLADDVIKQFSHLSSLAVINSRSSFQFKDSDKTISQLSKALKADLIMDGSYSIDGDKLHVKIELIGGRTNEIICYVSPIANMDEIKRISATIEREVFKALKIPFSGEEKTRKPDTRNVNIEAYKYYALGKNAMRDNTLQDREDIIRYFNAAIQLDSTYADPYIGIAEVYFFDLNRGYLSINEVSPLIREYALMAERLKPGSGEVQGLLGALYSWEFKTNDAIQYFEKSIQISPNYDFTYSHYAYALAMTGQFDQAIIMIDKASILDPLNNFYRVFKPLYLTFQAKYNEARELLETELKLNPDNSHILWTLAVMHAQKKDYRAAYEVLIKRGVGLESNFVAGYTYAMLGMDKEANIVITNLLEKSRKGFVPLSQLAIMYVGLEQYDKAIEQVEQAYLTRDSWFFWIRSSAMMDPIRDDPRFVKVMEMINY